MKQIILLFAFSLSISTWANTPEEVNSPATKQEATGSWAERLMPKYGNWCGANHPKDIHNADSPINLLDQACMLHDMCYQEKGYFNCECDSQLNQQMKLAITENRYSAEEKIYGRSFHIHFDGSPCQGDHSQKVGPSKAVHNMVKKVRSNIERLAEKLPFMDK